MKKIITYISILTVGLIATSSSAEARTYKRGYNVTYVSGHQHCGTPIYTKKSFSHYDRLGKAIFTYLRVNAHGYAYTPTRKATRTVVYRQPVKNRAYRTSKKHNSRYYSRH